MSVSVSKDGLSVELSTENGYTLALDGSSWGRGTRSGRYRQHRASGRTRESFSGAIHDDAVHMFGILIQSPGTPYTPQQVAVKLDELEAVMDTGGRITVTTGEGTTHSVIENVDMSEPRHEFLKGRAEVTYTLSCRPYWQGATSASVNDIEPLPGSVVFESGGDVDALTSIGLASVDATTGMIVSACVTDSEDYEPLHDFSGSADASALGGQAKVASVGTDWTDIAETAALDSEVYKGRYIVHARTSCASPIELRAVSRVSGAGMSGRTDQPSGEVAVAASGFRDSVLLPVEIPAGRVPDIETGSGYTPVAPSAQQLTHDESAGISPGQTVTLAAGERVDSVVFRTGAANTPIVYRVNVYATSGGRATGPSLAQGAVFVTTPDAEQVFYLNDWIVPATGLYAFRLNYTGLSGQGWGWRGNSAGGYAGGTQLSAANNIVAGSDLYFKVNTSFPLSFECKVALQAKVATSTANVSADYLMLHPTDRGGCTLYNGASGAGQGMLIDCLSHRRNEWRVYAYADDGTTIGANAALKVRSFPSPPRVWPGRTVIAASVFSAAAPDDGVLRVSSTERYLDASRAL